MAYENVLLEKEDQIAILSVNRPKALNALNADTLLDIRNAVLEVAADPTIFVLIVNWGRG